MTKKKPKNALVIELQKQLPQNPVAKFAHHVNKAGFFRDHTVYSRKGKHKDRESFLIRYLTIMNTKRFIFHQQKKPAECLKIRQVFDCRK
jgi:hypothetical protein